MSCDRFEQALGDYVDGELQAPDRSRERGALEAHLAECGRCRAIVADFRAIRTAARGLDAYGPPPQLWSRVAAGIDAERSQGVWWVPSWRTLAAAAALTLVAALGAWLALRPAVIPQSSSNAAVENADVALLDGVVLSAEAQYTEAIAGLEAITSSAGDELDPVTAEVLQANLTVIDEAIGESREALATEPTSEVAQASLFEALRVKVALLQDTIALINEMRQGDQEGTARIMTEINQ
jgi:anti-sigma factor RsiW